MGGNRKIHSSLLPLACGTLYIYRGLGVNQVANANDISPIRKKKESYPPGPPVLLVSRPPLPTKVGASRNLFFFLPCCGSLMARFAGFEFLRG